MDSEKDSKPNTYCFDNDNIFLIISGRVSGLIWIRTFVVNTKSKFCAGNSYDSILEL